MKKKKIFNQVETIKLVNEKVNSMKNINHKRKIKCIYFVTKYSLKIVIEFLVGKKKIIYNVSFIGLVFIKYKKAIIYNNLSIKY